MQPIAWLIANLKFNSSIVTQIRKYFDVIHDSDTDSAQP